MEVSDEEEPLSPAQRIKADMERQRSSSSTGGEQQQVAFDALREMEASEVEMHGLLGVGKEWSPPCCVTEVGINARRAFTDIKADEWYDRPEVLEAKIEALAEMIRGSENFIVFTGAGISVAAGIDDYATKANTTSTAVSVTEQGKAKLSGGTVAQCLKAQPTMTHRVLTSMYVLVW